MLSGRKALQILLIKKYLVGKWVHENGYGDIYIYIYIRVFNADGSWTRQCFDADRPDISEYRGYYSLNGNQLKEQKTEVRNFMEEAGSVRGDRYAWTPWEDWIDCSYPVSIKKINGKDTLTIGVITYYRA